MIDYSDNLSQRLVILSKAPLGGHVKTRLQPEFTSSQSVFLHRALVEHCLKTVEPISNIAIELWVDQEHGWWQELAEKYSFTLHWQQGGDLGERMLNAASNALSRGSSVVLIGTDCPFISENYLQKVFVHLSKNSSVVLGPALDGGYVLMGLTEVFSPLFYDIAWGTDHVLTKTRERLTALALPWVEMPTLRDIDRAGDVAYLESVLPHLVVGLKEAL